MKSKQTRPWQRTLVAFLSLQIALGPLADPAYAVRTQLADEPVGFTTQAEPNIVLTVDDSTSMLSDFLPDYIIGAVPSASPGVGGFCRDSGGLMSVPCGFGGSPTSPQYIYSTGSVPFPTYATGTPPNAFTYTTSSIPDRQRAGPAPIRRGSSAASITEGMPAALADAIAAMSEPMVSQDVVAFYLLAERVSHEVKVVLSGQGADEAFAGYFWYPAMEADTGSPLERLRRPYLDRPHADFLEAVTPAYRGADHTAHWIAERFAESGAETFLDQVLRLDVTTLIVDDPLKRVDNMTMAWGLEARVPLLDHELLELAARMPPALKLRDGGKYPLKAVARGLVPDAVIDRPKGYFPVPALKYPRGPFCELMRDVLTSDACRRRGLIEPAYIAKLLDAPEQHMTPIGGSTLRHLALLELWFQQVVDPLGLG